MEEVQKPRMSEATQAMQLESAKEETKQALSDMLKKDVIRTIKPSFHKQTGYNNITKIQNEILTFFGT